MRFADANCSYQEEFTYKGRVLTEHVYVYTGVCINSGKEVSVRVPVAGLFQYRNGALIQNAFPSLSVDEREFLISGVYHGWDDLFPEVNIYDEND